MVETMTPQANTVLNLLRRLPPRERLRVIAHALPEAERDLDAAVLVAPTPPVELDDDAQAAAEAQFKLDLLERGLLTEIKDPLLYPSSSNRTPPAKVEGTPLSEMIIAERR